MRLWTLTTLYAVSLLILSGCSGTVPVPKKETVIDTTLPIVELTANGTIIDTNSIALEWKPIEDQRVEGVYIYKTVVGETDTKKDAYYDTVPSRFSTHYLDTKIEPNKRYSYYFKTYSTKAESQKSAATVIASLPELESVVWIHSRQGMPKSAKILWRPHANEKVKAYIVQRRTLEDSKWIDVATVEGRLNAEYIDEDLKDNFTYIYRVRVKTYDGLISKPSQEVTVLTKELPVEVMQIVASTDIPKKIELHWKKSDAVDFLMYRIYRSVSINGSYTLLAETKTNSYVDTIKEDGQEYFYRISVVDRDKLESINSNHTALGRTLVKPAAPSLAEAKFSNGQVKLSWIGTDSRAKSYTVQKKYSKGFLESSIEDFQNIKGNQFFDSNVQYDKTYYYKIFSVDANGIKSEPSIEIKMTIEDKNMVPKKREPAVVERDVPQSNSTRSSSQQKPVVAPIEEVIVPMQDFN
ncbi:fibronectin type III domain-containing protein [Sulfurimonas sp.]|uniref:fibronectin type III domain-containing protein n=1 Tax=Sulfurimonas sp. TaxID=2022749 RepID=UPI003D0A88F5